MWNLAITNIAGIRAADVHVTDGLNVVQASNFTGKSSFIGAIQTVMGTSGMYGISHPLTEGADQGTVTLDTGGDSYEVRLERTGPDTVTRRGTPVLTDETDTVCARLFAFLGENNPIRARVRNNGDLTPLLQAPLDIEAIDEQIASLRQDRTAIERRLQEAEQAASNIPAVTNAISTLESEVQELQTRRDALAQKAAEAQTDTDSTDDDLAACQSRLENTTQTISRLEAQIERTKDQLQTKQRELDELAVPAEPDVSATIGEKEDRIETLTLQIDLLEGVHRANQRVLKEGELRLVSTVERKLIEDEVDCWICGEKTTEETIQSRLDALQETLQSLREEKATLEEDIAEIEATQQQIENRRRRKATLEEQLGEHRADLDELEGDLRQARSRKTQLEAQRDQLKDAVVQEELASNDELTDVKAELRTKQSELAQQRSRLADLEDKQDGAAELTDQKTKLDGEIEDLRARKTETQWELKDQFDAAMAGVIERFAPGFDGARLNVKTDEENEVTEFELIIARNGRETEIANLSEGEQELIGIVVALAGHRTFDVGERVPVMLLDGISQLSASNLRRLTEYLADTADVLITSAYPEAGEFDGNKLSPEEWKIVSDGEPSVA